MKEIAANTIGTRREWIIIAVSKEAAFLPVAIIAPHSSHPIRARSKIIIFLFIVLQPPEKKEINLRANSAGGK